MAPLFKTPSWYKPQKADTPLDTVTNALLPFLSSSDQRVSGTKLGETVEAYKEYRSAPYASPQDRNMSNVRRQFLSSDRATKALTSLERMKATSGFTDAQLGTGFKYLQDVISTLKRLGGTGSGGMTRAQFAEFSNNIERLTNKQEDANAGYANLASIFSSPDMAAGQDLMSVRKSGSRTLSGAPNPRLYR